MSGKVIYFFAFFALLGLGMAIMGFFKYQEAQESISWPRTDGIVKSSSVRNDLDSKQNGYTPNVVYEYKVANVTYTSDRMELNTAPTNNKSAVRVLVHKYPVGSKVTVYYNPEDPSKALLSPGGISNGLTSIIVGLTLAVGCGIAFFKMYIGRSIAQDSVFQSNRKIA
jgi:hypothetical protein